MKTSPGQGLGCLVFAVLLIASCGKEEPKPAAPAEAAKAPQTVAAPKPPPEKKPLPVAPQGKLPQMDPEKAKFIATPSTPKDKTQDGEVKTPDTAKKAEVKMVETKPPAPASSSPPPSPAVVKAAEVKAAEVIAKPTFPAPALEIQKAETSPAPEVKKAEVK